MHFNTHIYIYTYNKILERIYIMSSLLFGLRIILNSNNSDGMHYVHVCGQSFTKKRPEFWKCFHCDISVGLLVTAYKKLYIYIYIKQFTPIILPLFCSFCYGGCITKRTEKSGPMCMHAGSPLQKNAPIFGNVFTVTFLLCYFKLHTKRLCIYIYIY